jgi:hypothetical protein
VTPAPDEADFARLSKALRNISDPDTAAAQYRAMLKIASPGALNAICKMNGGRRSALAHRQAGRTAATTYGSDGRSKFIITLRYGGREITSRRRCNGNLFQHRLGTTMRMMLKFTLPVEKGNQAFKDGSLGKTLELVMNKFKPEAAYFAPMDGKRGGMLFFDLAEPSQLVELVEPLFSNLNATCEIIPVMTADDLHKGFAAATA